MVMKESPYTRLMPFGYGGMYPRWQDFLWIAKKTWTKDRERLIKEGKIVA